MDPPEIHRAPMPPMIYGAARKGKSSGDLVYQAIKAGFRGIDSGVGEHYDEVSVGKGLHRAYKEGIVNRSDLYIQTKVSLSDPRFPDDTVADKISWSVAKSNTDLDPLPPNLANLKKYKGYLEQGENSLDELKVKDRFIDCVLLHETGTVLEDAITAIRALQKKLEEGVIGSFGICNASAEFIRDLFDKEPDLIPAVIQNPFSQGRADFDVKTRWLSHGPAASRTNPRIDYQAFYTLSSNMNVWENANYVQEIANHAEVSNAAAWFGLLISANIVVLNGTRHHMQENIDDVQKVEVWQSSSCEAQKVWMRCRKAFLDAINGEYNFESQADTDVTPNVQTGEDAEHVHVQDQEDTNTTEPVGPEVTAPHPVEPKATPPRLVE